MATLSKSFSMRAVVIGVFCAAVTAPSADAITITYVNAGPADSRVFVGFDNMASNNTTSDLVADPAAYSRNDTLFGPMTLPFDADPTNRAVYDLAALGWTSNTDKTAKFKNSGAAPGGAGVRSASIKPDKKLKVVAKNLGDGDAASGNQDGNDIDLAALTTADSIIVVVTIDNASDSSSHRMCAQFDAPTITPVAGGTGLKVQSKTSSLPASCPP